MESKYQHRILTIPNILSFFRLLLIPFILVCALRDKGVAAFVLVAVSAVTDLLDGFIARRFDMVSDLGKVLDPVADKFTLGALFLCLTLLMPRFTPLFCLFLAREAVTLSFGMAMLRRGGRPISARWYGKLSTATMYATCMIHLLFSDLPLFLSIGLFVLSGITIVIALYFYIHLFREETKAIGVPGKNAAD